MNRYFIVKDRSGLDCSDVLLDYLLRWMMLDYWICTYPRIAKIAVFDQKLANRLVDAACKEAANPTKNKKEAVAVNKAVCTFLGACLQKTARADQEEFFEEVLALKDRLFKATGAKESATAASLGGGNIYVPSELSRLNYYSAKRNWISLTVLLSIIWQRFRKIMTKPIRRKLPCARLWMPSSKRQRKRQ